MENSNPRDLVGAQDSASNAYNLIMDPIQRRQLASLKKFVKSVAVVGFFAANGFVTGVFLGGYFLVSPLKPHYVNGVPQAVCGMPALAGVFLGSFLGAVGAATLGIYIAYRVWWQTAHAPFRFGMRSLFMAMTLISIELWAISLAFHH
jgi:hypothetical protein